MLRGRGASKAKIVKVNYKVKLEFPEGVGERTKKTLCGGGGGCMDIFWNKTMYVYVHSPFNDGFFGRSHSCCNILQFFP